MLELTGGSGGVGARVRDASWMGEGHDSTIKVDDTNWAVNCDPQPSADDVDLVSVVRVRREVETIEPVSLA